MYLHMQGLGLMVPGPSSAWLLWILSPGTSGIATVPIHSTIQIARWAARFCHDRYRKSRAKVVNQCLSSHHTCAGKELLKR